MPPDESIIPRRNVTPLLRADATDDDLDLGKEAEEAEAVADAEGEGESGTKYKFATGGTIRNVMPVKLVCPVCGLETCGHNLDYVEGQ